MEIIRDKNKENINIIENDKTILELSFIGEDFCIILSTNEKIEIPKSMDCFLSHNLSLFMKNQYVFSDKFNEKTDNILIWASDSYDQYTSNETKNKTTFLTLSVDESAFYLSTTNKFCKDNGINCHYSIVAFYPSGDGRGAKNIFTGTNLQDDLINTFYATLNEEKLDKANVRKLV